MKQIMKYRMMKTAALRDPGVGRWQGGSASWLRTSGMAATIFQPARLHAKPRPGSRGGGPTPYDAAARTKRAPDKAGRRSRCGCAEADRHRLTSMHLQKGMQGRAKEIATAGDHRRTHRGQDRRADKFIDNYITRGVEGILFDE